MSKSSSLFSTVQIWALSGLNEQFWPFEKSSIFSNGGHLRYRTALTDTILKGIHPRIISAKFGWDWPVVSEEKICFKIIPLFSNLHRKIGKSSKFITNPVIYVKKLIFSNGQNCSILSQKVPKFERGPNCISIMMSFLTYITGFVMNFELLPILTDCVN